MKITFEDTKIIRDFEGFSLKAYPDPATGKEPWTIAWGLTGDWVTKDLVLTQKECEDKFMEYLNKFCKKLDSLIKTPVTKNEYIALLSLMWNIGPANLGTSTLLKLLNGNSDRRLVAEQFPRWNKANGKPMAGLTRRREAEKALFLKA